MGRHPKSDAGAVVQGDAVDRASRPVAVEGPAGVALELHGDVEAARTALQLEPNASAGVASTPEAAAIEATFGAFNARGPADALHAEVSDATYARAIDYLLKLAGFSSIQEFADREPLMAQAALDAAEAIAQATATAEGMPDPVL